jgi:predicted CXXCH cytochrome family protein
MRELPDGPYFDYTHLIFGTGAEDPREPPLVPPGHPSFWTGPVRDFDARCSRCHVSGRGVTPPSAEGRRGETTWRALGIDCESCHGPGAAHAAHHGGAGGADPLLSYRTLERDRAVGVCLGCHMEGEVVEASFRPGEDVLEHVNPTLLDDPERVDAFGRPLELIYDGLPFLASRCATEGGLTCVTCHDPHGSPHRSQMALEAGDVGLCNSCHAEQADDVPAHAHHPSGGPGGRCVDCHMPRLAIERGHGAVVDHTIGVPRLEAPGDRSATDACTSCHTGGLGAPPGAPRLPRSRLVEAFAAWWPDAAPPHPWEQAVADARAGAPHARAALETLLLDDEAPRVYRATAARLLGRLGPDALPALLLFAADPDSLVRREALTAIGSVGGRTKGATEALRAGLSDSSFAVRGRAARAALEGWDRVREDPGLLAAVLPVLEAEAEAVPDDDLRWFRLGAARELAGDLAGAIDAYARQTALDPFATNVKAHMEELRARMR